MTGTKSGIGKRCGSIVQSRHIKLLQELAVMRVADEEQIKIACGFRSTSRVNARSLALTRAGLLRRFFLGSGAGRKALYSLSRNGVQLVQVPLGGPRRRQNDMLFADFFVQHRLSVNDVYCTLKSSTIPVAGVTFVNWLAFHEPSIPGLSLALDGYVEFRTPSCNDVLFIEVGLGHEGLVEWKEKTHDCLQFVLSGKYERQFRQPRCRILALVSSERRLHSIRASVAGITQKIFRFATCPSLLPYRPRPRHGYLFTV